MELSSSRALGSAARVGATASPPRAHSKALLADAAILVAIATGIAALERASGGYEPRAWAPAGVAVTLALAALLAFGFRPGRPTSYAAGLLVALGGWSVASTAWGGLPDQSWRFLGQAVVAAAALVLGSVVGAERRRLVLAGVLIGIAANAAELLFTPVVSQAHESWYHLRTLQGSVGYHNGQAGLMAIGLPLAVWGMGARRPCSRALAGAIGTVLAATLLLTQSRAGIGAAVLGLAIVLAWSRDAELFLRAVPLLGAAALLTFELREVDRALVENQGIDGALEAYAGWASLAAAVVGTLAVPTISSLRLRRVLVLVAAAIAMVLVLPAAVAEIRTSNIFGAAFSDVDPNRTEAGATRLVSLSLNGRRDAWRVAWSHARESPILGEGQGTFPIAWTADRRLRELYVLQPHSLVLELLVELGAVAVALFAAAVLIVGVGIARGDDRPVAAASLALFVAFLTQAALDWTWSLVGLVVAAMLVAGAAIPGRRGAVPSVAATVAGAVALACALAVLGGYWFADRQTRSAVALMRNDPVGATRLLEESRDWNRWNPAPLELLGRLAEENGAAETAADYYVVAARYSQSPWLQHLREARAARTAGDRRRHTAACARARMENPFESHLRAAIC